MNTDDASAKTGSDEEKRPHEELFANSITAGSRTSERATRERTFTRRALLKAGWALPVILAIELPQDVSAAGSPHGPPGPGPGPWGPGPGSFGPGSFGPDS